MPSFFMLTANNIQIAAPYICQKYRNITRENIFHRCSLHRKLFPTGIVPIARHSLVIALPKLSINCSNIANTNHRIKIKHFHMVCSKL